MKTNLSKIGLLSVGFGGAASLLTSLLVAQPCVAAERIQVLAKDSERKVEILIDQKPFTAYLYPTNMEKPVLYPLRSASGVLVTRGFPLEPRPGERVDHPHHVGHWFNYGDVNGLDFWNNSYAVPASKKKQFGSIVHQRVISAKSGEQQGELVVAADWVNYTNHVLLKEQTRFVFKGDGTSRTIDRFTTLTAQEDVSFPDNKEGVIALRVDRAFEGPAQKAEVFTDANGNPTTVAVLNNEGVNGNYHSSEGLEGEKVWGTRAKWMMLSARKEQKPITIAILDHPKNVGYPTYWHARTYGLYAANPLGQKAMSNGKAELNFKLPKGQSVTFKYRILITEGHPPTDPEMNGQFEAFARE